MKKGNLVLIILVGVLITSNLLFGYLLFFNKGGRPNFQNPPNMELTDEQISEVTSFFKSTTDTTAIKTYCDENRMECFYYCRNVDSTNAYCSQLPQRGQNSQLPQ